VSDLIRQEREYRLELWQDLVETAGAQGFQPQRLRELGIYGGAQGIWVDKTRTQALTPDGEGVTVGLLHTGRAYPDDLSEYGVLYHYPSTQRPPGRDAAEVNSTKAAGRLELPVFVITPGTVSTRRNVQLAWVEDWDDRARLFLISFGSSPTGAKVPEDDEDKPFALTSETLMRRTEVDARQGQQRFKFQVLKRYGPACAVCGIEVLAVLDAAHLCPRGNHGSFDPRNGLVLCALHHRALDGGLFAIHPLTTQIHSKPLGPSLEKLRILFP
jgi:putative restriction endonuclease